MDKEDARFQTLGQSHERRKQVVRLHRKGFSVMRIVDMSGLSYPTVRGVIDRYEDGGASTIKPTARGHRVGDGACLRAGGGDPQSRLLRQAAADGARAAAGSDR